MATAAAIARGVTDYISIHATHTGGDYDGSGVATSYYNFNPRHPYGWRLVLGRMGLDVCVISIHATHTGGDDVRLGTLRKIAISIHATHTGGD